MIEALIAEVLRVHCKLPRGGVNARVAELLELVGLRPQMAARQPHQLSGGQCRRAGIARALAVEPRLIVADECVAALDVSIQGQIVNLFMELTERMDLALTLIAHDLGLVRRLCLRVAVMYLGRIVEEAPTEELFRRPRHPYTAALIRVIPEIDPDRRLPVEPLPGEPPSPLDLPQGCAFHPRCAYAQDACRADPPPFLRRDAGHAWACILPLGIVWPHADLRKAGQPAAARRRQRLLVKCSSRLQKNSPLSQARPEPSWNATAGKKPDCLTRPCRALPSLPPASRPRRSARHGAGWRLRSAQKPRHKP